MEKNAGLQYVSEFTFSREQGFTGSAGVQHVRGYRRGGHVKKSHDDPGPLPANVKSHGGTVGVTTKQRKTMPQQAEQARAAKKSAKKGHGGSVHDKLRHEGEKMGYAYGGQVKNTSAEFVQKHAKQDSMDSGTYPPGSTDQADKEAGGHGRLKPKFKKGGGVHHVRDVRARKGMPKGVKARGGLAHYAEGGLTTSALGTGGARNAARALKGREERTKSVVNEALAAQKSARAGARPVKDKGPRKVAAKKAPGSERGKREHYGMPFREAGVKKRGAAR